MDWINETGLPLDSDFIHKVLGFVYRIDLNDGSYYYGRKQFWGKKGKHWYETDWREYASSSRRILERHEDIKTKSIIAIFASKSAIRYAEAVAIISSGSYLDRDKGLNYSFEGSRGRVLLSEQDAEQLRRLERHCNTWRGMNGQAIN